MITVVDRMNCGCRSSGMDTSSSFGYESLEEGNREKYGGNEAVSVEHISYAYQSTVTERVR